MHNLFYSTHQTKLLGLEHLLYRPLSHLRLYSILIRIHSTHYDRILCARPAEDHEGDYWKPAEGEKSPYFLLLLEIEGGI